VHRRGVVPVPREHLHRGVGDLPLAYFAGQAAHASFAFGLGHRHLRAGVACPPIYSGVGYPGESLVEPPGGVVDHRDGLELAERVAGTDLATVDASTLIGMVDSAPRKQLEAAFADETLRRRLLDEIFRRMTTHVRTEKVRDMHAVVRWRLTGG